MIVKGEGKCATVFVQMDEGKVPPYWDSEGWAYGCHLIGIAKCERHVAL